VATHKVPPFSSHAQFLAANNMDAREIANESFAVAHGCSLHMAIIQQPVRKWERPWCHHNEKAPGPFSTITNMSTGTSFGASDPVGCPLESRTSFPRFIAARSYYL
jgi:hypothetical protein